MTCTFRPCPHCGKAVEHYRNPAPTVDIIIYDPERGVVCIARKGEPLGHALPGGFVDYGERVELAAVREALEETGLHVRLTGLLGVYSAPSRDPRSHSMSTVFTAEALNPEAVCGGDDAAHAAYYPLSAMPDLVFDHARILRDFKDVLAGQRTLAAVSYPVETEVMES